jgi:biotin carboxylase
VSGIDNLSPSQADNLLRIAVQLEQSAVLAGLTFSMSLEEVVEAVEDFGGSLDDPTYTFPLGLVGKW